MQLVHMEHIGKWKKSINLYRVTATWKKRRVGKMVSAWMVTWVSLAWFECNFNMLKICGRHKLLLDIEFYDQDKVTISTNCFIEMLYGFHEFLCLVRMRFIQKKDSEKKPIDYRSTGKISKSVFRRYLSIYHSTDIGI